MNVNNQLIRGAIATAIALSLGTAATGAFAKDTANEKCAGIVKASKNDCGTSKGACAGTVGVDNDPEAWIYVPKGTCERIAGGTLTDKPYNAHGGAAGLANKG